MFELSPYADGTRTVTQALTNSRALTVVGDGDTGAAIRVLGFPDSAFGHVSTGGGASLEFIQGKTLPGLAALAEPWPRARHGLPFSWLPRLDRG